MSDHELAEGVAERVAHLHGATLDDVLAGRVAAPPLDPRPVPGVAAEDLDVGSGATVRVRRYERTGAAPADRPHPGVVWAHGGAWVAGELDMPEADAVARRLCADLDAIVYSVDYRLAPAHPYPAAMDDVVAAFEVAAADRSIDADRIVLGGASAGGNLAAAAAQVLRDRHGPQPAGVVLAYPATDPPGGPYEAERPDVCPPLLWFDREATCLGFSLYLAGTDHHPYAIPAAGELGDLPPTLVTTSALDGLEDQAVRYVELLRAAGVTVTHHRVHGVLHGYLNMTGIVDAADAALARHTTWIAELLGIAPAGGTDR